MLASRFSHPDKYDVDVPFVLPRLFFFLPPFQNVFFRRRFIAFYHPVTVQLGRREKKLADTIFGS